MSITFYSIKCIFYELIKQNDLNIYLNSIMDEHRPIQMRIKKEEETLLF